MSNRLSGTFLVACGLLAAGAAAAQGAANPGAAGTSNPDTATSGASPVELQEVVVTARHRAENLQNVPLTDTAVTAASIQTWNVTSLQDLNSFVPNMKISADRATSSTINVYIRGVGQSDPLWGFDPAVGVYIDDVYLARPQAALLDVLDVERLEVLSGPQGTLYGKNTIAGAIKYVTRDIVGPMHLTASVTAGNYGQHDFKLNFSTPVIDEHVYFGVSLGELNRGGYGKVVLQPGTTPSSQNFIGEAVSDKDVFAGRANLTFLWGASSKLVLVADDILDNSNAAGGHRMNDYLVPQLSNPFDMYDDMPVSKDYFHRHGFSGTYTQKLTDQLDLKVIGAYYEGHGRQFINFSETNQNLFEVPALYRDHQASGEGRLTFTNDLVKGVAGVFFMDSTACGDYNASIGTLTLIGVPLYITELVQGCVRTKSSAVYGDTSWKLTDKLDLDAGLRWNEDRKTAQVYQADFTSVAPAQLYPGQTFFDPNAVPAGFAPNPAVPVTDYTRERPFVNTTPRLGFDYHFTPSIMGYFTYSRGFLSGGFDMRGNESVFPGTVNGYNSEVANNFEVGLKSTWLDDTVLLNLTAFYDPYTDAQIGVQQFVLPPGGAPTNLTAVLNAGKQINQGVELQSAWRASRSLNLGLNVGYLDSYYKDYLIPCDIFTGAPGCIGNAGTAVNVADENRPLNAPRFTGSAHATYTWFLDSGSLLAYGDFAWRSFTKVANTTPSVTDQPGFGLLNAGLAYTTASGHWRISIDGKNLTDRLYRVAGYDFGDPPLGSSFVGGVSQIGFYGPPRTYSATVTYHY